MRKGIVTILLYVCCGCAMAQETISYLDWIGRPCQKERASQIYVLNKTDTGWCRKLYWLPDLQISQIYNYQDSACQILNGSFWQFYPNGQLKTSGSYRNSELTGIWFTYYESGQLLQYSDYSGKYFKGPLLSWHENGIMSDSTHYNPDDSTLVSVGWYPDGAPNFAGKMKNGKQLGKWKYYHPTGQLSEEEWYKDGNLYNTKRYDEYGIAEKDTTSKDREGFYKKGLTRWAAYIERNINFPAQYQTANRNSFTVPVMFTIDEEGAVKDLSTIYPTHPDFNKSLLAVMKKAPKWEPTIRNNRKVRLCFIHRFTFSH